MKMTIKRLGIGSTIIGLSWLMASCATSPTGRRQVNLVPDAQVGQMGDQAWQEVLQKTPESKDQAAKDFVNRVAQRVIAAGPMADKKWDVHLLQSKEVNAFALPAADGGHIGVFTAILPIVGNEAGLATVLAHETGHVIAKHSNERVSDELVAQGALGLASAALGSSSLHGPLMGALGLGAQYGVLLPFSRNQESEADEMGFMIMAKAGYDPNEALQFWQRMVQSTGGNEPPAFLSDHPATADRIARLKDLLPKALEAYATSQKTGAGARAPAAAN